MSNNGIESINKELNVEIYNVEEVKQKIYTIRGKQVMLDRDLAELYMCKNGTKTINQAVKRNIERFPERFMFQLTEKEYSILWSQFGTTWYNNTQKYRRNEHLPFVFTEQGVAMLATVIRTDVAVEVSLKIMDAFVQMRHFLYNNSQVFERLTNAEYKLLEHDKKIEELFNQFQIKGNVEQKIFFDGQVYDAFSMIIDLIRKAENEIILIDNYVDTDTLNILSKKNENTNVKIFTKKETKLNSKDIDKFNIQYSNLEIKYTDKFHDRFLILDRKYIYHIGASLKDLGKKCFGITLIKYDAIIEDILSKLQ